MQHTEGAVGARVKCSISGRQNLVRENIRVSSAAPAAVSALRPIVVNGFGVNGVVSVNHCGCFGVVLDSGHCGGWVHCEQGGDGEGESEVE